jgi:hypothetical protein
MNGTGTATSSTILSEQLAQDGLLSAAPPEW